MTLPSLNHAEIICKCRNLGLTAFNSVNSRGWVMNTQNTDCDVSTNYGHLDNGSFIQQKISDNLYCNQPLTSQANVMMKSLALNQSLSEEGKENKRNDTTVSENPRKTLRPALGTCTKRSRGRTLRPAFRGVSENPSTHEDGTDCEENLPKKRVKSQKINNNLRQVPGQKIHSHKVAAGFSGSLPSLRPIAINPSYSDSVTNYRGEIAGDPTPALRIESCNRPETPSEVGLSHPRTKICSKVTRSSTSPNTRANDQLQLSIENSHAFTERNVSPFDSETPPGLTSSPPTLKVPNPTRIRSSPQCPSSPVLPRMPKIDSGFMSGSIDELSGEAEIDEGAEPRVTNPPRRSRASNKETLKPPKKLEFIIEEEYPGPMNLLPRTMPIFQPPTRIRQAESSHDSTISEINQTLPKLRKKNQTIRSKPIPQQTADLPRPNPGSMTLPTLTERSELPTHLAPSSLNQILNHAKREPAPLRSSRSISPTWADGSCTIDVHSSTDPTGAHSNSIKPVSMPVSLVQSQSSSKKEMIRHKLELAIANGEMPPFCCNCGAIETPTWRKAWSKEMKGVPGYFEYSDEPGRVTAIIILTRDHNGKPTSYHLIKKYLGQDENQDDYNEYLLCNPCGIWMSKYKTPRPEERWESHFERSNRCEPKKRPAQRLSRSRKAQNTALNAPPSETNFLPSEAALPSSEPTYSSIHNQLPSTKNELVAELCLETHETNPQSLDPLVVDNLINVTSVNEVTSIQRGKSSSPDHTSGTEQSPINLEDTPVEKCHLLFSSPVNGDSHKDTRDCSSNTIPVGNNNGNPEKNLSKKSFEANTHEKAAFISASDADMIRLFEQELNVENDSRPATPSVLPRTTPRKSPKECPISCDSSETISIKSSDDQFILQTPGSIKLSPSHSNNTSESPFTATLNKMISEANKDNTHNDGHDLGCLSEPSEGETGMDINFNYNLDNIFKPDFPFTNNSLEVRFISNLGSTSGVSSLDWSGFDQISLGSKPQNVDSLFPGDMMTPPPPKCGAPQESLETAAFDSVT
ncbi:Bgt-4327 [Blumeria graminis f. sp. tritici]|uniref:Gata transcription factor protein n=3 Tax=Blumeria graminis f. sp. tritici TaxID=62690 RepID=A0A656KIB4_BLUGR|nr:hypothetical protein BGT96224_4327 [Blumeria graminis f. sp. tritici 96224]VDB94754.1 Bgt-4327 [Blumeria graminis f. sp. tritici]